MGQVRCRGAGKRLFGALGADQGKSAHKDIPVLELLCTRTHMRNEVQTLLEQSHCSGWYQATLTMEGESMETTAPESQFP